MSRHPHSCRDESHIHGDPGDDDHGQGGHGHHHHHDHSVDKPESGEQQSLLPYIDITKVVCLNEHEDEAGQRVFRSWDRRMEMGPGTFVDSSDEHQLIFKIPFTVGVKLKSINIIGPDDDGAPSHARLWKNKPDIDFDTADRIAPDQELVLPDPDSVPPDGTLEHVLKRSKFLNVSSLTVYIDDNFGDENTRIYYIGLKGEATESRRGIVECVYEAAANPADHKKIDDALDEGVDSQMW